MCHICSHICSGLSNPVLATAVVFIPIFGALSLIDCFLGREGWYLIDLKQTADAAHYFGKYSLYLYNHTQVLLLFRTTEDSATHAQGTH